MITHVSHALPSHEPTMVNVYTPPVVTVKVGKPIPDVVTGPVNVHVISPTQVESPIQLYPPVKNVTVVPGLTIEILIPHSTNTSNPSLVPMVNKSQLPHSQVSHSGNVIHILSIS